MPFPSLGTAHMPELSQDWDPDQAPGVEVETVWTAWLDRLTSQEGPIKLQLHQIREPGLFTQWDCKPPGHYKMSLICGKGRSCFQPGPDEAKGFSTMSPPLSTPPACDTLYGQ